MKSCGFSVWLREVMSNGLAGITSQKSWEMSSLQDRRTARKIRQHFRMSFGNLCESNLQQSVRAGIYRPSHQGRVGLNLVMHNVAWLVSTARSVDVSTEPSLKRASKETVRIDAQGRF